MGIDQVVVVRSSWVDVVRHYDGCLALGRDALLFYALQRRDCCAPLPVDVDVMVDGEVMVS